MNTRLKQLEARLHPLMVASQAGDAQAYRILLSEIEQRLRGYFRTRVGDPSRVDDLVQETLMAVHIKRDTYDPGQPATAWVFAIARYKLVDFFRAHKRQAHLPIDDEAEALGAHDAQLDGAVARLDLDRMMAGLSDGQIEALRLTKIEGLSMEEAAARSGRGVSWVKVNVHRGLNALRSRFQDRESDRE